MLENHHIAASFEVMCQASNNILVNFSAENFKKIRQLMIGCVLGTDMAKHMAELGKFKSRLHAEDYDAAGNDKDSTIHMLFHLADISNSTKNWDISRKWVDLLFIEYFEQGDIERNKGVPISYLMDRTTVNVAKCQIGFLDFIISPSFTLAVELLPNLAQNMRNVEFNRN